MSIEAMKLSLAALEHEAEVGNDNAYLVERNALRAAIEQANAGETSDGYHSFNELYAFRKAYNAALFNELAANGKCSVHKSWRHYDGELCFGGGWFIVVAMLPSGQISNHYEAKDWGLFKVPATERAMFPFDGHTGADVVARLSSYAPAHIPIEQAQEPVAHTLNCVCGAVWDVSPDGVEEMVHAPTPSSRQWQWLTHKEIVQAKNLSVNGDQVFLYSFARAIEAKLKEKNT